MKSFSYYAKIRYSINYLEIFITFKFYYAYPAVLIQASELPKFFISNVQYNQQKRSTVR